MILTDDQKLIVGLLSARIFIVKSYYIFESQSSSFDNNPEKYGISNLRTFWGLLGVIIEYFMYELSIVLGLSSASVRCLSSKINHVVVDLHVLLAR